MIRHLLYRLAWLGVFVAAATVAPVLAHAEASLDDTIVALMQKRRIPGLSLAVVQDGKIVKARGYGVIENGSPIPVTEDTLFQAASISKPVAALGALRRVDAGRLSLDVDVNTVLHDWRVPENEFTATEKVTLRRLLSHTAGLTVHGFPGYPPDAARPTLVQLLNGEPPTNTAPIRVNVVPGSIHRYSGGGYSVMQQLVLEVSGQTYPAFMRESVLEPLGMHASTFEQPLPPLLADRTATGHRPGASPVPGRWHVYPEMAAAGLWTTPSDLARFIIGLQAALAGQPDAVLSPATAALMVTPVQRGYGLGLAVAGDWATQRFSHGGRNEGFDTQLVAFRDTGQGAVVMINANDDSQFMNRVLSAIVREYHWPDFDPAPAPRPIEDKEPEVTTRVRAIFDQAQQGKFEPEWFGPELAAILAREIPKPERVQEMQGFGAFQSITLIGRETRGTAQHYRYHLVFAREALIVNCIYTPDGKIVGINFQVD